MPALAAIMLFVFLGSWQLHRADEKTKMLHAQRALANQSPVAWDIDSPMPKQYQPLRLEGHYLPDLFLLDNQHYKHQFGYHVLSPFELHSHDIVLVDRGWIAGDITRQSLPVVNTSRQTTILSGKAYYPSDKNWVLGDAFEKKSANMTIVELIDTNLISQLLHKTVYPFIIRLDKSQPSGFIREWKTVSMPPERHYAYALQWFIFAAVALVLLFTLNMKKKT